MNRNFPGSGARAGVAVGKPRARKFAGRFWQRMLALSVPVVLSGTACGQEALRQSQTGAAAAAGQQSANATVGYYNLKMGDLTLRVLSGASVQYNDNVRLRSGAAGGGGAPDDFIFVPSVSTQLHYPVTQHNSLDLSITAGYTTYLQHSELNQFYVNPGSGLTFNIFIGDLVINLHDRVSVSQSGYQNPTANGNGNNSSLENNAGVTASWNLNKLDLAAGYNHGNYISLGSGLVTPDASTDNIFLNAGATVRPELVLGAEVGATSASYNRANTYGTPNLQQWSAGMFSRWKITDYMNAQAHVGYSQTIPEGNTSTNLNVGSGGGMYFGVTFAHRVNQVFSYTLAAERSQNLQSYGQAYETYSVRWSPSYQLFRKFSVSTPVWWTKGTQFYNQANSYEQYGLGLNVERQLTEKLAGAFTYQFINETSDEASLNYVVNIISLTLTYRF